MLTSRRKVSCNSDEPALCGKLNGRMAPAAFFSVLFLAAALLPGPTFAEDAAKPLVLKLKPGQAVAFAIAIAEGKVAVQSSRLGKLGALDAADGEIVVGLQPHGKDVYAQLVIVEKTAQPIDFVATAYIDTIKIDEPEICGRLTAPFQQRVAGTSWSVVLRDFSIGKGECPASPPTQ